MAVHLIQRGEHITDQLERDLLVHKALNHPHVIKVKDIFLTVRHLAVVLEDTAAS